MLVLYNFTYLSDVTIYFYVASCIARIAMTLYGLGEQWYSESVFFFETADSVFTECSSLPEYKAEETQVSFLKF